MNRRTARYAGIGLALFFLFLIVAAPASLLAWAVARASNNAILLQAVSGTVWSGSGELLFTRPNGGSLNLGRGSWSVNPLWLVTGRVGIALDFKNAETLLRANARVGINGGTVKDVDVRFSASLVPAVYPAASLAGPSGEIRITAKEFEVAKGALRGQISALWTNAATAVSDVRPLGDYRLVATGEGKALALGLTTLRGEMKLVGQGTWTADAQRLQFTGTATPSENSALTLGPLLRLMGRDQGGGKRVFVVNLSL